jgi:hypothetical protein
MAVQRLITPAPASIREPRRPKLEQLIRNELYWILEESYVPGTTIRAGTATRQTRLNATDMQLLANGSTTQYEGALPP